MLLLLLLLQVYPLLLLFHIQWTLSTVSIWKDTSGSTFFRTCCGRCKFHCSIIVHCCNSRHSRHSRHTHHTRSTQWVGFFRRCGSKFFLSMSKFTTFCTSAPTFNRKFFADFSFVHSSRPTGFIGIPFDWWTSCRCSWFTGNVLLLLSCFVLYLLSS